MDSSINSLNAKINHIVDQINKTVAVTIEFGESGAKIKPPSMPEDLFSHYEVQYLMCEKGSSCENTSSPGALDWDKADTVLFKQLDGKLAVTGLIPGRVYWFRARAWSIEGGVGEKWFYENTYTGTLSVSDITSESVTVVSNDPTNSDFGKVTFACNYNYSSNANYVQRIEIWDDTYTATGAEVVCSIPIEDFKATGSASKTVFIPEYNNQMSPITYHFYVVDINTEYQKEKTKQLTQTVNISGLYPESSKTGVVSDRSNFIVKFDVSKISNIFSYSKYRYKKKKVTESSYGSYSDWIVAMDTALLPNSEDDITLEYKIQYQLFDKYGNVYYLDNNSSAEMPVQGVDITPPKMVAPIHIYAPYFYENFDGYTTGYHVANLEGDWDESEANAPTVENSYKSGSSTQTDGGKCVKCTSSSGENSWFRYSFSTDRFVHFAFNFRFRFDTTSHSFTAYLYGGSSTTEGIKLVINQGGTVIMTRIKDNHQILSYSYGAFTQYVWYNIILIAFGVQIGCSGDCYTNIGAVTLIINDDELLPAINTEYHDNAAGTAADKTHIKLASTASATDDKYNGMYIRIMDGAGAGSEATIIDYDGTTRVATLDREISEITDSTTEYFIMQLWYTSIPTNGDGKFRFEVPSGGSYTVNIDNIELYKNNY